METIRRRRLRELRRRLALLNGVIADFERLETARKRRLKHGSSPSKAAGSSRGRRVRRPSTPHPTGHITDSSLKD
jgi:hypothetical protein